MIFSIAFFQNGKLLYFHRMNGELHLFTKSFFQKESLDDCSTEELEKLAAQYSYSSPFQLLLAHKYKTENAAAFEKAADSLSIYFPDNFLLEKILNAEAGKSIIIEKKAESAVQFIQPAEELQPSEPESMLNHAEVIVETKNPSMNVAEETNQTKSEVEELTFQPYHAVDYFASQGIKPAQEDKPADRFGRQLKSFTEWLKVMKRLTPAEISKTVDTSSEQKVESLAQTSISENEVVTEAMAEVWIKQGEAIEIYHKLSLLNPSKSHYFAGLIEELKNS